MAGLKQIKARILPRTLYGRSLMIIVLPVVLIQLIVGYIFLDRHWDSMSDKLAYAVAGEVDLLTNAYKQAPNAATKASVAAAAHSLAMDLTAEEGKVEPTHADRPAWYSVNRKLQEMLERKLDKPFTLVPLDDNRRFEVRVQLDEAHVLRFVCYYNRVSSPTTYIFLLWLIGSSIILTAVAVIFMRNQVRPIHRLAIAAEKLGKGQDIHDFKMEGAREVRQAGRAFVDMRDRIRRQIEQRTAMLAGVSHDLRTPLTRMKLELEMMKETAPRANLLNDLAEMEKMLEGYLTFARGQGGESTELVDMRALLDRLVANTRRQGGAVQLDAPEKLTARVRPVALERALSNLVSNACKYAKHVWIAAHAGAEDIEITVDDDGPGIPQDLRDEVFKPFYRLEKSRNPKTGGVGLGLSIAQDIVHGHGGEIHLADSPHGGLRATVRLPL